MISCKMQPESICKMLILLATLRYYKRSRKEIAEKMISNEINTKMASRLLDIMQAALGLPVKYAV